MSRNYGLGSRDMSSAAWLGLSKAMQRGELSFSSVDSIADRCNDFFCYAKHEGVRRMEHVTFGLLLKFGQGLAIRVANGEITPAYAQNIVSAVNTVMRLATRGKWQSVNAVRDCGIPRRDTVRKVPPDGLDDHVFFEAKRSLIDAGMSRQACIAELAVTSGLRLKEASLLDAVHTMEEIAKFGYFHVKHGTKGDLERIVQIMNDDQVPAIARAAALQGKGRNLIPPGQSWAQWRDGGIRDARKILRKSSIRNFRDLRAACACRLYRKITGHDAPVISGRVMDRASDELARRTIALELGHHRSSITVSYVGGRK